MTAQMFLPMGSWSSCETELCPIVIKHDNCLQLHQTPSLLSCFSSPDLARPALTSETSQVKTFVKLKEPLKINC